MFKKKNRNIKKYNMNLEYCVLEIKIYLITLNNQDQSFVLIHK